MTKEQALKHWLKLKANVNPLRYMIPIRKGTTGSRYGACGIRIDGNPQFIDAVLGKLKDLIDGENQVTRLELSRQEVKTVEIGDTKKYFENADNRAEVVYIRLHERGPEAQHFAGILHKDLEQATVRFAKAKGIE